VLIRQAARPRVRPQGNLVYRLNRSHRLAAELRALVLFGGAEGLGRELVTGSAIVVSAGTATLGLASDGPAFHAPALADEVATEISSPLWQIEGDITVACRVFPTSASGTSILQHDGNPIGGSYFEMGWGEAAGSLNWNRATPGNHWNWWRSPTGFVTQSQMNTHSVTGGASIGFSPLCYVDGIYTGTAVSVWANGNTALPAGGSANPLRMGRRQGNTDKAATGFWPINVVAARQWTADEHLLFHLEPYAAIEEAPRWYFGGGAASGTTYNDTISDATTAADATASALTIAGAISEPATAADAAAPAHVAVSSIADAATAGEATAAALVASASVTDAATGGDATAAALVAAASASDATTAADTTASAWTGAASVSDAATATDAAVGALGAVTYNETISDSATAGDSLGAALAVTATISDGLNTLDALAALLAASDIVVDAVAASDGLAAAWTAMASVSDTLAVGDLARIGAEFLAATPERTVTWPYAARAATWIAESRAVAWPATSRTVTWRQ